MIESTSVRAAVALPLLAALTLGGCLGPQPEPPDEPARVENATLGLAIAALPDPFRVAANQGRDLVLEAPGPAGPGRLVIAVGPEQRVGINLIQVVKDRKAEFEAAPGGVYHGNRELMTPIGTAFSARGEYDTESGRVEETWIYAIHPSINAPLSLTYTYPTGESQERVGQLTAVLGEIEGIGVAAE